MMFECPKCHHGARAEIDEEYKFLIYKCPQCNSNVVHYDNKLDVISDKMIELLKRKNKQFLGFCKNVMSSAPPQKPKVEVKREGPITPDRITDLKILLETESDFDKLISKL
jgi:hypothetical protein